VKMMNRRSDLNPETQRRNGERSLSDPALVRCVGLRNQLVRLVSLPAAACRSYYVMNPQGWPCLHDGI
jgi:hypothetical protein